MPKSQIPLSSAGIGVSRAASRDSWVAIRLLVPICVSLCASVASECLMFVRVYLRLSAAREFLGVCVVAILVAAPLDRTASAQYEPPRDAPTGTDETPLQEARRVGVGVSVAHDSNLFRDPALVRDPQSETITTGYATLLIDKPYAQQRFFLSATANAYRYDKNSYLNFDGFDYRAEWDWRLTSHLTGLLSASRTEAPTQFEDTLSRQSDVTTTNDYVFNINVWLFGGWTVLLGVSQSDRTSEQALLQGLPDYRETRGEAGLRYLFQAGTSVDALWRRIEGEQDSQLINNVIVVSSDNYEEDQSELRANWILSGTSRLTGRVTYLDRRYDLTPENDFSGTGGELAFFWLPTSKLNIRLAAMRNIVPWQSLTSNYRVTNAFSIAPTWQATAKTSVFMNYQRIYDNYPASSAAIPERDDTTDVAALGLNWLPTRTLSIGASVQYQQRASNNPLVEYDATIGRLSASVMF